MNTAHQVVAQEDIQLSSIFDKVQRRSATVVKKLWFLATIYFATIRGVIASGTHVPQWIFFPSLFAIIFVLVAQSMYVTVTLLKTKLTGSTTRNLSMWLYLVVAMVATVNSAIFLHRTN